MKRISKKIIVALVALFMILSSCILSFGIQLDTNRKQDNKEYKTREVELFGGLTLVFNDEIFFDGDNNEISSDQKRANNYMIAGVCGALVVYWIALLLLFEKEDKKEYMYRKIDDIELLKKYNPMVAGCLVDNRQVLSRDLMAVVLNLIHKDYINLEMIPNKEDNKEDYIYMISENKSKNKGNLDDIEIYVLNWIFGFFEEERVDLIKKLRELSKRKDFLKHMSNLNNKTEKKLHAMGANIPMTPKDLRIFNVFLLLFTVLLSVVHIINNGVSIHVYHSTVFLMLFILACVLLLVPVVVLVVHLVLFIIVLLKRLIKSTAEIYSGKKMVQMSALVLVFLAVVIFVVYMLVPNKYICLDIFMIGMAVLIVKTDNLMTKHSKEVLDDYYALNEIKDCIQEYSLIKNQQINYIKLWDEYLIYAVAFGIPIPIVSKLKGVYKEDQDLRYLAKCENLYYAFKAYIDIIRDFEYKERVSWYSLENLFETNHYR